MRTYEALKIQGTPDWDKLPVAPIDNYLWSDVRSIVPSAQLGWDESGLYVRLQAVEPEILCRFDGDLDPVCQDSCLEFFFCPEGEGDLYFNFEVNPNGSFYVGYGRTSPARCRLYRKNWKQLLQAEPFRTENGWGITYKVPVEIIRWYVPDFKLEAGMTIRGNFFKCGDDTAQEHYMSWNAVDVPHPNFHLPDYFGRITLK